MADAEKKLLVVIGANTDEAENKLTGFRGALQRVGEVAAGVGLERLAEQFLNVGRAAGEFAVKTASDFEQWGVSFETMLGSTGKASQLLSQISDFAIKTPFELPQLVEGSKRLLAYNVEADQLIPTLKTLGNLTAGLGTEKLPQLILAYGQVKAATKLTGMELRQFSEAGVPLLDALVKQANAAGGSWVTMGGAAKKSKVDVGELNDKLAIARKRLEEASASGKTKESTLMSLRNTIQNYEQKVGSASGSTEGMRRVFVKTTVTAQEMMEKISDGEVSFDMVQEALKGMTEKGGKFFNLMERQALTFGGIMSNLRDNVVRLTLSMMGFDMAAGSATFGLVKEGSLFDVLRKGAASLLDVADIIGYVTSGQISLSEVLQMTIEQFPQLTGILQVVTATYELFRAAVQLTFDFLSGLWNTHREEINTILNEVLPKIQTLYLKWVEAAQNLLFAIEPILDLIREAWKLWGDDLILMTGESMVAILDFVQLMAETLAAIFKAVGHTLRGEWKNLWEDIKSITKVNVEQVMGILNEFANWVKFVINPIQGMIGKIGESALGIKGGKKALGGYGSGMTLVGENGPELVKLPAGSYVHTAQETRGMSGNTVNIYNPVVRSDNDITELVRQVKMVLGREVELARLGAI